MMSNSTLVAILSYLSGAFWAFLIVGSFSIFLLFNSTSLLYASIAIFLFIFIALFMISMIGVAIIFVEKNINKNEE